MSVKLQTTTNYSQFEQCDFNRDVKKIDKLLTVMKREGFIAAYPIHCVRGSNGKLKIKAGHHRFEAAKRLGIPLYYVVSDDNATVVELEEATVPWKFNDFLLSHVRSGSESHLRVKAYSDRTGISYAQACSLLGGESASSMNLRKKVKDGTYEAKDNMHSQQVGNLVIAMKECGVPFYNQTTFVAALCKVAWVVEFEDETFIHRVRQNPGMMVKQSTKSQYVDLIERVYNHGARTRIPLSFLADEAAKQRCPTTSKKSNELQPA